jgi:hypothetical protein
MQAQAAAIGVVGSAQLGREMLMRELMQTEELAELSFPQPPTWKQFDAACKKALGKHLTFEYFPDAAADFSGEVSAVAHASLPAPACSSRGALSKTSPRGVHVKDARGMKKCIEWLLLQPRPGEMAHAPVHAAEAKGATDAQEKQVLPVIEIVLPCVLAVELMPSEEDAEKVCPFKFFSFSSVALPFSFSSAHSPALSSYSLAACLSPSLLLST